MKELIGWVAVLLTLLAYIPYYRDILRGKTHPHLYSWLLWGLLTVMVFALQVRGGAGAAAYITIAAGLLCIGVIVLSLKQGAKDITRSDTVMALLSLAAMAFWLAADRPGIAMSLVILAELLAFLPTIRKSWHKPHSETLSLYVTNTVRFGLALLAVRNYTLLSVLWPAVWVVANGLFSVMLVLRRRQL